ncbi:MAG: pitrilysin family protein [Deferrisomatales bacterium]|nr:pitrilysin family protein [Deferrisomatales bacterium]
MRPRRVAPRAGGVRLGAVILALGVLAWGCGGGRGLDPRTARFPGPEHRSPPLVEAVLSGGAPVFLLEDRAVPLVRVYAVFRGGSLYDPAARAGLAAVASLTWRTGGAGELSPEAVDEALEDRAIALDLGMGRESGWATLSVLPGDLERGLELLSLLLFEPAFAEERFAWAVGQVGEGIRRETDSPRELAFRELRRGLYPGHPRGVVPTLETIGRVTRDDVVGLHRRLLGEGAWALGAVGDFEGSELLGRLEARLGSLPGSGGGFPPVPVPAEPEPRTVLVPRPLPQATVLWARLGPGRLSPDFHPLDLADHLLGSGGFSSRLMRDVRSDRGLAYSVGSFYQALPDFGVLGVHAATRVAAVGQVVDLLRSIPREASREGFPDEEVAAAREALVNRHVFRYEDPASVVRERLGLLLDGLPPDLPARYPEGVQAVEARAASAAAAAFDLDAGVLVVVGDVDPTDPRWAGRGPVEVVTVP